VILLKNDEVIDFLTSPPTDFSALKNAKNFRGLLYFAAPGTQATRFRM